MNFGLRKNKFLSQKKLLPFFLLLLFLTLTHILNNYLKVNKVNVVFFDDSLENLEIKRYIEANLRDEGNSLYSFLSLEEQLISKLTHDEFQLVSAIKISKKINMDIDVVVSKNDKYFYSCMPESLNFLVRCMLGNSEGVFYKEINDDNPAILRVDVNTESLFASVDSQKVELPDSLSGTRIYHKQDFLFLRETVTWLRKNGFAVEKIYVDDLRIATIYTDKYSLKINLERSLPETLSDFSLVSRSGELQTYINEKKERLEYIDLSYKNKVFWKLKNNFINATGTDIMTATSKQ